VPTKKTPAVLAQNARDLVEELNRLVLDEPGKVTAPNINDTLRALTQLVDRLPQAFEQLAAVLEMRAKEGVIGMDTGEDPDVAAGRAAGQLRTVAADAEALVQALAAPARILHHMDHRG
jgi:hypothetical protein